MHDYTTTFLSDATPDEAFAAINNVRGWWGRDVDGTNDKVGDEFTFRVQDVHYSKLRATDLLPNEKIVWLVLDNRMDFVDDQSEWVGTMITFEITHDGAQTEVRFTHVGLTPEYQCFETCSNAWTSLMHGSLPSLIETGAGQPYE